jgi:hypothetical protein
MSGSPCTRYLFVFRKPHEIMRLQAPRFQTQPLNRADPAVPRFITKTPMSTTVAYFRPSFLAYLWDRRRQTEQNR